MPGISPDQIISRPLGTAASVGYLVLAFGAWNHVREHEPNRSMIAQPGFERCKAFIDCQIQATGGASASAMAGERWRAVTISRQTGSGAHIVGEELARYMQQ